MKICARPIPSSLSRAMFRVYDSLVEFHPSWIELVDDPAKADFQILHSIGHGTIRFLEAPRFAMIQYCFGPSHPHMKSEKRYNWGDLWRRAELIWGYYDLSRYIPQEKFHFSPLGLPKFFAEHSYCGNGKRDVDIITSGYVTGPGAEAIGEVARAAAGSTVVHIGPRTVKNMIFKPGPGWVPHPGVTDNELAAFYRRSKWVSGLRHVEGFEFPVIEGLMSGARPIVFDRPDMRQWYNDYAVFIPECHGEKLVGILSEVLSNDPVPVTKEEQDEVKRIFSRRVISDEFWSRLREKVGR